MTLKGSLKGKEGTKEKENLPPIGGMRKWWKLLFIPPGKVSGVIAIYY